MKTILDPNVIATFSCDGERAADRISDLAKWFSAVSGGYRLSAVMQDDTGDFQFRLANGQSRTIPAVVVLAGMLSPHHRASLEAVKGKQLLLDNAANGLLSRGCRLVAAAGTGAVTAASASMTAMLAAIRQSFADSLAARRSYLEGLLTSEEAIKSYHAMICDGKDVLEIDGLSIDCKAAVVEARKEKFRARLACLPEVFAGTKMSYELAILPTGDAIELLVSDYDPASKDELVRRLTGYGFTAVKVDDKDKTLVKFGMATITAKLPAAAETETSASA